MKSPILRIVCCSLPFLAATLCAAQIANSPVHLPSSKEILPPVPGSPRMLNSLPMTPAWSPGHRYLALVNADYGTVESNYDQSVAILDTVTGRLTDFPGPRTALYSPQILYSGIAFSRDVRHLYVSFDSLTAPNGVPLRAGSHRGSQPMGTDNGVAVYRFTPGSQTAAPSLSPERVIHIPLRSLTGDQLQHHGGFPLPQNEAIPAPAGLAVIPGRHERLLVADEYSDDAVLLDAASGKLLARFDLSSGRVIPSTYPVAVVAGYSNQKNGLIYKANTPKSYGAKESARMDFSHEDRAPARELNIILWKDAMGNKPVPYLLLHPFAPRGEKAAKDNDGDGD